MTEFSPRTEPVASVSATDRALSGLRSPAAPVPGVNAADAEAQADPQLSAKSATTANYAKLQADIADVVAQFDPPHDNPAQLTDQADKALMALMPQPVVVLPLPPTDQHMIDFVAQVAQSVASQAAMARAAQEANVSPALTDAAVH